MGESSKDFHNLNHRVTDPPASPEREQWRAGGTENFGPIGLRLIEPAPQRGDADRAKIAEPFGHDYTSGKSHPS
jgi:hypothetical protein